MKTDIFSAVLEYDNLFIIASVIIAILLFRIIILPFIEKEADKITFNINKEGDSESEVASVPTEPELVN